MMTLELGRTSTWRLPRFSALTMLFRQSAYGCLLGQHAQHTVGETCERERGGKRERRVSHSRGRRHAWLHGGR